MTCARSEKCLARVPRKGKKGQVKFCGKPAKFNDLCRKHDRRMVAHVPFNQEINN